jgi:zinc protease
MAKTTTLARGKALPAAISRAGKVQKIATPSGLTAWLVEDYAVPLVAMEFSFKGGTSQDTAEKAGAAAMLAALLDEGAGDLDSQAFHRALEEKAIELSFGAGRDFFSGQLRTLAKYIDRAFELTRLAVTAARLDDTAIERVRAQLAAGIRSEANDPDAMAGNAWRAHAFPQHPYGLSWKGTLDTIARVTRDDLVALKGRALARDALKIAIVGAIDAKRAAALLDVAFGDLPARGHLTPVADIAVHELGGRHIVDLDVPQATIRFGSPGIARKDDDHMAAVVVNHILGGGVFSARLFKEVREKRGLAYSVYSHLSTYEHAAVFSGGTSTKNERAAESLKVIQEQIADLAAKGPTPKELDKARNFLIGSYDLRFDTSSKIASQLVTLQNEGFDADYLDKRNPLIAAVSKSDAARVAKRLLGGGKLLVTVAGRPQGM